MSLGKITVEVQASVQGPAGKLKAGQIVALDDSPYVRVLVKSGNVVLIDPPSLDEDYLIRAGLIEAPAKVKEDPVKEESKKEDKKAAAVNSLSTSSYLTRKPKVSEEPVIEAPAEKASEEPVVEVSEEEASEEAVE